MGERREEKEGKGEREEEKEKKKKKKEKREEYKGYRASTDTVFREWNCWLKGNWQLAGYEPRYVMISCLHTGRRVLC